MALYTFLTVRQPSPEDMAAALAEVLGVQAGEVDVADDTDGHRDWTAPVLCDYTALNGDLALSWDVRVAPRVGPAPPAEAEAALMLAARLGTTVLHPAGGVRPSAYWAATPDGVRTRARVLDDDTSGDGPPSLTVDAVEEPVGQLPRARVERILEAGQDG
ncbi:hypothetical protein [Streptomyces sp. NPDC088746]|uniref:hypothetical protein n=1 Tax=Streptomyces sp. NPDC088746 TaxID=3365885 RepID=UPI00382F3DA4